MFAKAARLVIVLYRAGWGETNWTRIEESAIRSRAFEDGYDFVLFVALDDSQKPKWLPKQRIWYNWRKFGTTGLVAVIDCRIEEAGGVPRLETVSARAARLHRELGFEDRRKRFLASEEAVRAASEQMDVLYDSVKAAIDRISAESGGAFTFKLEKGKQWGPRSQYHEFRFKTASVWTLVHWYCFYGDTVDDSGLK